MSLKSKAMLSASPSHLSRCKNFFRPLLLAGAMFTMVLALQAAPAGPGRNGASDPGVRGGPPGAGSPIAGAQIVLINHDTGIHRESFSNAYGYYAIPLLPPGIYWLIAEKQGFRPAGRSGMSLSVNQIARQDIILALGTVHTAVTVPGDSVMIQSSSVELGLVIGERVMTSSAAVIGAV